MNARVISVFMLVICAAILLSSCAFGLQHEILGQWKEVGGIESVEFFKDGTVTFQEPFGISIGGNYKWIDKNRIRIELGGLGALIGPQVATVSISGGELRLADSNGKVTKYSRT